jgi:hypothetical protein
MLLPTLDARLMVKRISHFGHFENICIEWKPCSMRKDLKYDKYDLYSNQEVKKGKLETKSKQHLHYLSLSNSNSYTRIFLQHQIEAPEHRITRQFDLIQIKIAIKSFR